VTVIFLSRVPEYINWRNVVAARKCLLDVMMIELDNMDLYAGVKENEISSSKTEGFKLGFGQVTKRGPSLLKEKFQLKLQVERNLSSNVCHNGKYTCGVCSRLI
jgi:hypothetical protein